MRITKKTPWQAIHAQAAQLSLAFVAILGAIATSSYILAGWLMRPDADDYSAINAYHTGGLTWLASLPHTVISGGGRYAQTLIGVLLYGPLGIKSLHFTAIISVCLFLLAASLAIFALRNKSNHAEYKIALCGGLILFLIYTSLSVTFPGISGKIDNSFQGFIWLPGFITYTLPFELLVIVLALATHYRRQLNARFLWLALLALLAIGLGTFNEIMLAIYTEVLFLGTAYVCINMRFKPAGIKRWIFEYRFLYIIELGLIVGLLLNAFSAATAQRIAAIHATVPTSVLVAHTLRSTQRYLVDRISGAGSMDIKFGFAIAVGIGIGAYLLRRSRPGMVNVEIKNVLLAWLLSVVMVVSSVFICFAEVFKGYGINSYLVPRFEIFYNSWITVSLLLTGVLITYTTWYFLGHKRSVKLIPWFGIVLILLTLGNTPRLLSQMSSRLEAVAVFSHNWDVENRILTSDAKRHVQSVVVPGVDIGDAYAFEIRCSNKDINWLEVAKQNYYHIQRICTTLPSSSID